MILRLRCLAKSKDVSPARGLREWPLCKTARTAIVLRRYSHFGGAPLAKQSKPRWIMPLAIAIGMSGSGIIGYLIASRRTQDDTNNSLSYLFQHPQEPVYGSPEDFFHAIAELKHALPSASMVSTEQDNVYSHGTSTNDYHKGEDDSTTS